MGKQLFYTQRNEVEANQMQREFENSVNKLPGPYAQETINYFRNVNNKDKIFLNQSILNAVPSSAETGAAGVVLGALALATCATGVGCIVLGAGVGLFTVYAEKDNNDTKQRIKDHMSKRQYDYLQHMDNLYGDNADWHNFKSEYLAYLDNKDYISQHHLNLTIIKSNKKHEKDVVASGINFGDSDLEEFDDNFDGSQTTQLALLEQVDVMEKEFLRFEQETGLSKEEILAQIASIDPQLKEMIDNYKKTAKSLTDLENRQKVMEGAITELTLDYAGFNAMLTKMYVDYQKDKSEKIQQRYAQHIQREWQRIQKVTNVIKQAADLTGNKKFIKAAEYAKLFADNAKPFFDNLGIKTLDNLLPKLDTFLKNAEKLANIATAVLFVAQLLFFKDNKPSFETVVIQYLQQISQQLDELQKSMDEHFARVNDKLENMFRTIVLGFREVLHEIQVLQIYAANRFDKLETDIFALSHKLDIAIEAFWLRPLIRVLRVLENSSLLRSINEDKFNSYCDELIIWVTGESSDTLSTGEFLVKPAVYKKDKKHVLKDILQREDINNFMGLINGLCDHLFNIPVTNEKVLYNPAIWFKAAHSYLQLTDTNRLQKYKEKLQSYINNLDAQLISIQAGNNEVILALAMQIYNYIESDTTIHDDDILSHVKQFHRNIQQLNPVNADNIRPFVDELKRHLKELMDYADKLISFSQKRDPRRIELARIHEVGKHILSAYSDIRRLTPNILTKLFEQYQKNVNKIVTQYRDVIALLAQNQLAQGAVETTTTRKTQDNLRQTDVVKIQNLEKHSWYNTIPQHTTNYSSSTKKHSAEIWNDKRIGWNNACTNQITPFIRSYTQQLRAELDLPKNNAPINNFATIKFNNDLELLMPLSIIFNNLPANSNFEIKDIHALVLAQKLGIANFEFEIVSNGYTNTSASFTVKAFFKMNSAPEKYPVFTATLVSSHHDDNNLNHADQFARLGSDAGDGPISQTYEKLTMYTTWKMQIIHGWLNSTCTSCTADPSVKQLNKKVENENKQISILYKEQFEHLLLPGSVANDNMAQANQLQPFKDAIDDLEATYQLIKLFCELSGLKKEICDSAKQLCHEEWIYKYIDKNTSTLTLQQVLQTHIGVPPEPRNKVALPYKTDVQKLVLDAAIQHENQNSKNPSEKTFNNPLQVNIDNVVNRASNILFSQTNSNAAQPLLTYREDYIGVLDPFYAALFFAPTPEVKQRYRDVTRPGFIISDCLSTHRTTSNSTEYNFEEHEIKPGNYDDLMEMTRADAILILRQISNNHEEEFTQCVRIEAAMNLFFSSSLWPTINENQLNTINQLHDRAYQLFIDNNNWLNRVKEVLNIKLDLSILGTTFSVLIQDCLSNKAYLQQPPPLPDMSQFITNLFAHDAIKKAAWLNILNQPQYAELKNSLDVLFQDAIKFVYQLAFLHFTKEQCVQYCDEYLKNINAHLGILSLSLVYKYRNIQLANQNNVTPKTAIPLKIWQTDPLNVNGCKLLSAIEPVQPVQSSPQPNTLAVELTCHHLFLFPEAGLDYHWLFSLPSYLIPRPTPYIAFKQRELNKRLLTAATTGNDRGLVAAITDGADTKAVDETNKTAICLAAENGKTTTVTQLIANNVDKNYHTIIIPFEKRPKYSSEQLSMLINILQSSDLSPLFLAAREGHLPILEVLFNNETLENEMYKLNHMGISPILAAAAMGKIAVIRNRLSTKQSNKQQNDWILDLAVAFNYQEIFDFVITRLYMNDLQQFQNQQNLFLLFAAVLLKNEYYLKYVCSRLPSNESTKALLNDKLYNHPEYNQINLLMFAALQDETESINFLREDHNVDCNSVTSDNKSALIIATEKDNVNAFKELFLAKAQFDKNQLLALCASVAQYDEENEINKTKIIRFLYNFGRDGYDHITHTDLLFASANSENAVMLAALVDEGIDLTLTNSENQTINDVANQTAIDYLNELLHQNAIQYTASDIEKLLVHGFESNTFEKQTKIVPAYCIKPDTPQGDHDYFEQNLVATLRTLTANINQIIYILIPISIEKTLANGDKKDLWTLILAVYDSYSNTSRIVHVDPTGNGQENTATLTINHQNVFQHADLIKQDLINKVISIFNQANISINTFSLLGIQQISANLAAESGPILIANTKNLMAKQPSDSSILTQIKDLRTQQQVTLATINTNTPNLKATPIIPKPQPNANNNQVAPAVLLAPAVAAPKDAIFIPAPPSNPAVKPAAMPLAPAVAAPKGAIFKPAPLPNNPIVKPIPKTLAKASAAIVKQIHTRLGLQK